MTLKDEHDPDWEEFKEFLKERGIEQFSVGPLLLVVFIIGGTFIGLLLAAFLAW